MEHNARQGDLSAQMYDAEKNLHLYVKVVSNRIEKQLWMYLRMFLTPKPGISR